MKIVAMADLHGAYRVAVRVMENERPDLVILAGDITDSGHVAELLEALPLLQAACPRVLAVAGNMDGPAQDEALERLGISVNATGVAVGSIGVFGVSGAPVSPLKTRYEIPEEEIARRAEAGFQVVRACSVKIFVPHAPPYGTRVDIVHEGFHVGSTAVRDFVENRKPDLVLCGHIHEGRGIDAIEQSRIVNCGPLFRGSYAIVTFEPELNVRLASISPFLPR